MSVCHLNLMQAKTSSLLPAPDNSQNHKSFKPRTDADQKFKSDIDQISQQHIPDLIQPKILIDVSL